MILNIDDDEHTNYGMHRLCQALNIESIEARNYDFALTIIQHNDIGLILCDMMFGHDRLGGLDFIKKLKKLNFNIPVVIVSSDIDQDLAGKVLEAGAVSYLEKPVTAECVQSLYSEHAKSPSSAAL